MVTSFELIAEVARLAGWEVVRWCRGDEPSITHIDTGEAISLGQPVCVLRAS